MIRRLHAKLAAAERLTTASAAPYGTHGSAQEYERTPAPPEHPLERDAGARMALERLDEALDAALPHLVRGRTTERLRGGMPAPTGTVGADGMPRGGAIHEQR